MTHQRGSVETQYRTAISNWILWRALNARFPKLLERERSNNDFSYAQFNNSLAGNADPDADRSTRGFKSRQCSASLFG